jgi:hypothetical protein
VATKYALIEAHNLEADPLKAQSKVVPTPPYSVTRAHQQIMSRSIVYIMAQGYEELPQSEYEACFEDTNYTEGEIPLASGQI